MPKKILYMAIGAVFILSSSGCATIAHGTSTMVSINTRPSGAEAIIGGTTVITPATVILKNNRAYDIIFKKDGYEDAYFSLQKEMSGWIWGNVVLGGIIGMGIDMMSGGAYKIKPTEINVDLASAL